MAATRTSGWKHAIIVILILVALALLGRFVVFSEQYDAWIQGRADMQRWADQYKTQHPEADESEVKEAVKNSKGAQKRWKDTYIRENPNATDEQIESAREAQRSDNVSIDQSTISGDAEVSGNINIVTP